MKAGVILYDPLKQRFKARTGFARGWSGRLEHAQFYDTKEDAAAAINGPLRRLKPLNVYLVEDDIDHALEPLSAP